MDAQTSMQPESLAGMERSGLTKASAAEVVYNGQLGNVVIDKGAFTYTPVEVGPTCSTLCKIWVGVADWLSVFTLFFFADDARGMHVSRHLLQPTENANRGCPSPY